MSEQQSVIVVTGGASGIGEATVRRFAQEPGRTVVIGDINIERAERLASELRDTGASVHAHALDVSSQPQIKAFCRQLLASYGVPQVLVNSGGLLQNAVHLFELDIEEYDRLQNVNVRGTLLVSRELARPMCEVGGGSIINLCSLTSFRPSAQIGYAVGKAGLHMLTQVMAAQWGPQGVRVNAVAPGYTLTPAMQARIDSGERDPAAVIEKSALRRFVDPAEVAETIHFLCSKGASAITGAILPVDCGWLVTSAYAAYASQPC
ncbi:SDR family NAD(P)-dependent oxidoreductase [Pseudomonas sp. NPDC089422]|uniref:SDR family NAD(P)-dependent oxidoreductase n=1 Tax=Pseudomonas sp. NPDC089422 TaxID=3364466 RepID=UPI003813FCB5